ncbi:MAG: hypothetical protein WD577_05735 [Bacteroidales bacterium]
MTGFSQVWVYDCPGGDIYKSPDYEVRLFNGSDTLESFVYYSYGKDSYVRYNWNLQPETTVQIDQRGPERHSTSIFSFTDSVTVQVKINSNANNITLPLKSAKILPSSYNISCKVKEGNIIEFKLDRPEKVVVFPNYDEAWDVYAQKGIGHVPIKNWESNYQTEKNKDSYHGVNLDSYLSEGYQNPLFIFAHPPERRIPDSSSVNTIVVNPGDNITQSFLNQYDTVWFTPGIHDLSQLGEIPWYQTMIKKGQTFYLEGGSYVKARFKESNIGEGKSSIIGRGIISGTGHKWVRSFPEGSQVIQIDSIIGVTITDRAGFGIYGGSYIGDVGMIGAWHGNTDGLDYVDNCLIENCFLMAHDDNLKINHNTHARHCVIWQGPNAHAIMVKETFRDGMTFANSVVEDIDIVAYMPDTDWDNPWPQISRAAIAVVSAQDAFITNFEFKDIRIEAPYLSRVFNIYNLNTNEINPGWFNTTSASYHTKIDGIKFSNITVKSPVIGYNSLIGAGYYNSLKNISLEDITINGTRVTLYNREDFLQIECDMVENFSINGEQVICAATRRPFQGENFHLPLDIVEAWQYDFFQDNSGNILFAMDSAQTIGIYGCDDTTGLNIRSYIDAADNKDAAQFKWDELAETFSTNGQWLEYSVDFDSNDPYQLMIRARNNVDADFQLTIFNPSGQTAIAKDLNLMNDFVLRGGGNEQTDWFTSKFELTNLMGPKIIRFDWYDNLGELGIFGAFKFKKSDLEVSLNLKEEENDSEITAKYNLEYEIINLRSSNDLKQIMVYNIHGQQVDSKKCSGKTFQVSVGAYYPGVYLVVAHDNKGNVKKLKIRK